MKWFSMVLAVCFVVLAVSNVEAGILGRRRCSNGCNVGSGSNGCLIQGTSATNRATAAEAAQSQGITIPPKAVEYRPIAPAKPYYDGAKMAAFFAPKSDVATRSFLAAK